MHAIVVRVTINDVETATQFLNDQVVPRASAAPGFVAGYWTRGADASNGVSMVVFPGGGFQLLAIDLEGTEICDWMTAKGITCVLLKYRVPKSNDYHDNDCDCRVTPKVLRSPASGST